MEKAITPEVRLIFAETISNPGLKVADIEKMSEIAHQFGIPLFLDNTMATRLLARPIALGADVVIHYDPWWNIAVQNQATDRAHRIGQTKKVVVYRLIAKGTIEEKIQKLQESKKALSDQIIQGETGQLSGMTKEDFLALLE